MDPKQSDPLASELREAETTMEQALEEACDAKPASEAETGELIRVDELLAVASDAAKRAISLRRRGRVDRNRVEATLAHAEAVTRLAAAHRVVTGARGIRWDVFAVYPEAGTAAHMPLPASFQSGWLCFNAGAETRRLGPIPENWQALSEDELAQLAERAEASPPRRRRGSDKSTDSEAAPPAADV